MGSGKIKLKVCGMRDPGNIDEVCSLGVDYMGFIFFEKSPRYVGKDFRLPPMPPSTRRVGVFVNESVEVILERTNTIGLDMVQLHGNESVDVCRTLRQANIKVIKAFPVDDSMDFRTVVPYHDVSDFFLFDTRGERYGGNAKTFNWELLTNYDQQTPFFISGGLTPGNIGGLAHFSFPGLHALDLNSGVEIAPGLKAASGITEVKKILNTVL